MSKQLVKIAVVGDVHDQWDAGDRAALKHLGVDLLLLVGDFGNESVDVVRSIAATDIPKAAIMGNHDAWYSASDWGKKMSPYDHALEDRVQQQLDALGKAHVGYSYLDFPELDLTVVGARPFSWGGSEWRNAAFYHDRYGIDSFAESAERIVKSVAQTAHNTLIFLGHNGPFGLGDRAEDPCGKDWDQIGGDYGDPDLAESIEQTRLLGKTISLVAFGHMHHKLRQTNTPRKPIHVSPEGTVYLNAACVPRIIQSPHGAWRNFSIVTVRSGLVEQASLIWIGADFEILSEQVLFAAVQQ